MLLRPPKADEGPALTALCLRAKAAHGYDDAFMEACRGELTVDPRRPNLMVAEMDGTPVGLAEIHLSGEGAELEKLFVEPAHHRSGVGRRLFEWARAEVKRHGARRLLVDSDPGAVAFYERMGATLIGESPSGSIPGRLLPRLGLPLDHAEGPDAG